MLFSPDTRYLRKLIFLKRKVSQILNRIRYSWMPFSVDEPPITFLNWTNRLILYGLFHLANYL